MKNIFNLVCSAVLLLAFGACEKAAELPFYTAGTKPNLQASTTTMTPVPDDSNKVALTLTWTEAKHSVDPANVKYTIEIDSAGKNFSNSFVKIVTGATTTSFTNKDINTFLINRGYAFNAPISLDVRVTSSFANNNESLSSDLITVKFTTYKVPPKVPVPTSGKLFLVGDATQGGWSNPVPVPSQEFAKIDETTWGGIFQLNGGKQYLILPVNGDWSNKFSVANNSVAGLSAGGDFGFNLNDNFPGPATSGFYKIIVDFQSGKFTVTPYNGVLPANLFIVGDATAGGWSNPVPLPSQQLTRLNSAVWQITLPLVGGKQYLLLPANGDWSHKYAVSNNSVAGLWAGGAFGYDLGDNFPGPPTSGTYTITVNFLTNTFTVK